MKSQEDMHAKTNFASEKSRKVPIKQGWASQVVADENHRVRNMEDSPSELASYVDPSKENHSQIQAKIIELQAKQEF